MDLEILHLQALLRHLLAGGERQLNGERGSVGELLEQILVPIQAAALAGGAGLLQLRHYPEAVFMDIIAAGGENAVVGQGIGTFS
jgi:hypothetical protein